MAADEDWKDEVKAQDAALEEKLSGKGEEKNDEKKDAAASDTAANEAVTNEAAAESEAANFPPPDFPMIVSIFSTQAMLGLGMMPNPATGEMNVEPELARHMIDCLAVLEEKTKGNLTKEEAEMLDGTLHYLRMTFLEKEKESPKASE